MFDEVHLSVLRAIPHRATPEFGEIPRTWIAAHDRAGAFTEAERDLASDTHLDRAAVTALARDGAPAKLVVATVLAWGSLRHNNSPKVLADLDRVAGHVDRMRAGGLSRADAFGLFQGDPTPGLGVAYFTKLIYFALPHAADERDRGFILDQWTAKSLNLLTGRPLVKLSREGSIDPKMTPSAYEAYCAALVSLADELGDAPTIADERIFSRGVHVLERKKQSRWPWRQHVEDRWAPPGAKA